MENNSKTVSVECGRCVRGTYYYTGGSGVCFACGGTGTVRMSAAKHAALIAGAARMAAAMESEKLTEAAEDAAFQAATAALEAGGIEGARNFFRTNRTDKVALVGLICALRNEGMHDEANAVVRFRNAM